MLYIEPGSPWENGYSGVFKSNLRGRVPDRGDLLIPPPRPSMLVDGKWYRPYGGKVTTLLV